MLADAAGGAGQRVVHDHGFEGLLQAALLIELEEARDVHVQRATVLARRERQVVAHAGAAAIGADVVFELVAEVPHGGEHRVGRGLAQAAQRGVADHAAQLVQPVEVGFGGAPARERVQDAQRLVQAHAAGNALAAGLRVGELDEVARHIHHAVVFIHHHHAAGAHDGAELRQGLVVHRGVEHLLRDAAAGGAAGLHGLDVLAVAAAFADVVDEGLERRAQRHLHQAGVVDLADQREDLGAGALGAAGLGEPGRALGHDGRDVVPGLDVVDVGGLAPQALLRRERRTRPGPSGVAFERGDQRGLFAADERARAFHQLDVEVEAAAQDVVAQQAVLARLLDGARQAVHRQRIFGAHVDDALGGAHHVAADDHAFQQRVRIALDLVAVHVGAGIAFVGIADDVLLVGHGLAQELPLVAGEEAGAAAAAQLGGLDLLDHHLRVGVDQHLVQRLVAADGDVLLDIVGVDQAAVAQHDLLLRP